MRLVISRARCLLADTYVRCPPTVNSYYYYCYPTFIDLSAYHGVYEKCVEYHGLPVWLSDADEFTWLKSVLQGYRRQCFHMGRWY